MSIRFTRLLLIGVILLSLPACMSEKPEEQDWSTTNAPAVTDVTIEEPTETPHPTIEPGDTERLVMVGDLRRSYLLHIPPGLTIGQAVPVVFAFHGNTKTPTQMEYDTGFNGLSDRSDSPFLVAYPAGVNRSWNTKGESDLDEIAFVEEMLIDLNTIVNIDPKRIYTVGFSRGGVLAYQLACEMSDTFASIAAVSASSEYSSCTPTQAVSLIHIHGLNDPQVPFTGGGMGGYPPVEEVIQTWVGLNKCKPGTVVKDNLITQTIYSSCQEGTTVELRTIEEWGHSWPDQASNVVWTFFSMHPKP